MKAHKAINTIADICTIADYIISVPYIHMVIGHMKAHKAINTTSVPLLTMHMFLYPHGDRSYGST